MRKVTGVYPYTTINEKGCEKGCEPNCKPGCLYGYRYVFRDTFPEVDITRKGWK